MVIQKDNEAVLIPLELTGCIVHFKLRTPNPDEIKSLNQYCLTQDDTPWRPFIFSDKVTESFITRSLITSGISTV
jgi:hypothetical protein